MKKFKEFKRQVKEAATGFAIQFGGNRTGSAGMQPPIKKSKKK
jgi:hypothetical protein